MRWASYALFGALASMSTHCSDPLVPSQSIERLRLIGARATVEGDEPNARPNPEQTVVLEWLVVAPASDVFSLGTALAYSFSVCPSGYSNEGVGVCLDAPFVMLDGEATLASPARLTFEVPDASSLGEATSLLVRGGFCRTGPLELDANGSPQRCGDAAEQPLDALFEVPLANAGENENPNPAQAELLFDDEVWAETSDDPCETGTLVRRDGQAHAIRFELGGGARETVPASDARPSTVETLQVSHLATGGLLDRQFSSIEPEEASLIVELPWSAPKPDTSDELVHFYFVVRDLRGGVSWLERTLCIDR
jgi:hypothetical protein